MKQEVLVVAIQSQGLRDRVRMETESLSPEAAQIIFMRYCRIEEENSLPDLTLFATGC